MSDRDTALANGLIALLQGKGTEAVAQTEGWPGDWLARTIQFLAYSFYLYEPTRAMSLYGGVERFQAMAASETVERYVMRGFGAMFRREPDASLEAFRAAVALAPDDPFVLLGWFLSCQRHDAPIEERADASARLARDMKHPAFAAAVSLRNPDPPPDPRNRP
jgi:hypothetical protein